MEPMDETGTNFVDMGPIHKSGVIIIVLPDSIRNENFLASAYVTMFWEDVEETIAFLSNPPEPAPIERFFDGEKRRWCVKIIAPEYVGGWYLLAVRGK